MTELLPTRATFAEGARVEVEVLGDRGPGIITVRHLGDVLRELDYDGSPLVDLGELRPGGYGVELQQGDALSRSAVEVSARVGDRMRYGFVVDYSPDRDVAEVARLARRLHLTDIQFYDWAYRHADLLGGGEDYRDALDQPVSLGTVRRLISALNDAGSRALGYAAVYAAGPAEWPAWEHRALLTATGAPYALGDFLFLVDPAASDWIEHFGDELARATAEIGFDGFHLDQYGYPKRAVRPDGAIVDVSESFATLIGALRERLEPARLVFNNVNDFPTWRTAGTPQDAVYIEVWEPTLTLGTLAAVVTRARSVAEGKPVVIAAYQHVYDSASPRESDLATSFTMAALYSHGATQLLAGESDRLLVDPYYVRNHVVEQSTADLLRRWYDFLVEHDELLMDPGIVDVTAAVAGPYNDDCDVTYESAQVKEIAEAGSVWRRITESEGRTVLHLINLVGQNDTLWDAPRREPGATGGGVVRVRCLGSAVPRVRVADPDAHARLVDVEVIVEGDYATARLPALGVWQLVLVEPEGRHLP